jgi:hypothetical protein
MGRAAMKNLVLQLLTLKAAMKRPVRTACNQTRTSLWPVISSLIQITGTGALTEVNDDDDSKHGGDVCVSSSYFYCLYTLQ